MYPHNYQNDYFLYIATAETTIAMVLVQVENGIEHLIYYLSHNINDTKVKYSHVKILPWQLFKLSKNLAIISCSEKQQ